jgi:hypothetical protein
MKTEESIHQTVDDSIEQTKPIPVRKKAGESTHQMADRRLNIMLIGGIATIIVLLLIAFVFIPNAGAFGLGGGGIVVLIIAFFVLRNAGESFIDRKSKEARRARRGAKGEEKVGDILESLAGGYKILHDVECTYGNIDHLVITENGSIFMIETKAHGGKVTIDEGRLLVNGKDPEKDFIAQSLRNSFWLREQVEISTGVKPWITPILVFTNAFVSYGKPIKGVIITNKKFLVKTILLLNNRNRPNPIVWQKRGMIIQKIAP